MSSSDLGPSSLPQRFKSALLFYAWGKVCFDTWDWCLEELCVVLSYEAWPREAKALIFALYPAYFAYSSAARITGSGAEEGLSAQPKKQLLVLIVAFCLAALKGASSSANKKKL